MDYMIKLAYAMRMHALRWELEKFAAPTNLAPTLLRSASRSPMYKGVGSSVGGVLPKWGKPLIGRGTNPIPRWQIAQKVNNGNKLDVALGKVEHNMYLSQKANRMDDYNQLLKSRLGEAPLPGLSVRKMDNFGAAGPSRGVTRVYDTQSELSQGLRTSVNNPGIVRGGL